MLTELIVKLVVSMAFLGSTITLIGNYINNQSYNFNALYILGITIVCISIALYEEFILKRKRKRKYKNYQEVEEYLVREKSYLKYEKEDRERLTHLIFFDWIIYDDSNKDRLILSRKTSTKNETKIFIPNKKSL